MTSGNVYHEHLKVLLYTHFVNVFINDRTLFNFSDDLEVKNIIRSKYGYFLINIGVFDLYPKPLSTIRKHCKRNEKVLQAYTRAMIK